MLDYEKCSQREREVFYNKKTYHQFRCWVFMRKFPLFTHDVSVKGEISAFISG